VKSKVPHEIEVSVKIDTDAEVLAGDRALGIAVLAPQVAVGLIEAHTIRVGERDEDDTGTKHLLDL
jgi:hypothetical protein